MKRDALISPCGRFRYWLTRSWDDALPVLAFCMLNPSKADHSIDDPTVTRGIAFAKQLGYGGLVVVNLFAYRATDPKDLADAGWPVGPDNNRHLAEQCMGRDVICAWGANVRKHERRSIGSQFRTDEVLATLHLTSRLFALAMTKDNIPGHPLYLPANSPLLSISIAVKPEQAWVGGRFELTTT